MLYISGIEKRFGGRAVLSGVSLRVEPGEYVAIVGESGSGKSTLLNIVAGLEPADAGHVSFGGASISDLGDDERTLLRRDNFGFVFQAFHVLPHLTVLQNVILPLLLRGQEKEVMEAKARQTLSSVGLAGREESMPRELSGGELQRVAIARALVGEPKLVLADEPTGNLDTTNGEEVMQLLTELNDEGTTIAMVTHSHSHAEYAHRIVNLLDGTIVTESIRQVL